STRRISIDPRPPRSILNCICLPSVPIAPVASSASDWPFEVTAIVIVNWYDDAASVLLAAARSVLMDTAALLPPPPHAESASATAITRPARAPRRVIRPSRPQTAHQRYSQRGRMTRRGALAGHASGAPRRAPHCDRRCER